MRGLLAFVIGVFLMLFVYSGLFVVDETEQVVILQFGKPVRIIKDPGLHFKIPFLQTATFFEKRLLEYDSAPNTIITKDKKNLIVDNYAEWRIRDPLRFLQTMRTIELAHPRLDDIIYSSLRVELGKHTMHEIVVTSRDSLMSVVTKLADEAARDYGVEIVDVRIKRADLPKENEKAVFDRMRAERNRKAKQFRSEGDEESLKIRAETDKERQIILAEAYRKSQIIRGEAEAEATRIYAEAFKRSPEFYNFIRSLEAYKKIFDNKTKVILTPESEIFRYLKSSTGH